VDQWVKKMNFWVSATPVLPGVWRHRDGGVVVRAHTTDPRSGRLVEIKRHLPDASPTQGLTWLEAERAKIRREQAGPARSPTRFHEYAAQLMERKVASRKIAAASGRTKWKYALLAILKAPWAQFFVDKIKHADLVLWRDALPGSATYERVRRRKKKDEITGKTSVERFIEVKRYDTTTLNGWLDVLRTICAAMTREHELPRDPSDGLERFDEEEPYQPDAPNALSPERNEIGDFLERMQKLYPQHFAITFLGLAIGHRPSTLRPLRRKGATPDVVFFPDDTGKLYLRRSHTERQEVLERIKTKKPIVLNLPKEVVHVLRAHIAELEKDELTAKSELLFPSLRTGKLQSKTGLAKAFDTVRLSLDLPKLSPKAMRRTWKDVARSAGIEAVVRKAVTGHSTDAMEVHYSTASEAEKRDALQKVVSINMARAKKGVR
jgi:integrase